MLFAVIEVDVSSNNCPRDVLLIYHNIMGMGEAEVRLCGHLENWEWMTSHNTALLQLISDASDTYQGFELFFESMSPQGVAIGGKLFQHSTLDPLFYE